MMSLQIDQTLYALHDHDAAIKDREGAWAIDPWDADQLNEKGYGIFWTVNTFAQSVRQTKFLQKIRAWFVEMDYAKDEQRTRLARSPLYPSLVIESKRSFQAYFYAKDATLENYKVIQQGLADFFNGDARAKDVARILRAPGYKHLKDPTDPFLVTVTHYLPVAYREREMLKYFPVTRKDQPISPPVTVVEGDDLTTRLNSLNALHALQKLSGTTWVNGDVYEFRKTSKGYNIVSNGKSTSCFIDSHGRIGAVPGGPTIFQWLKYYGHTNSEIRFILKTEFGI
jgi:hypothetical protein